jgi:hypothetical protein
LNLPQYPNPKDFKSMEEVMIPYIQAYGSSETIRRIMSFMNEQEFIIRELSQHNETRKDSGI